jgi:hypothetical protein
MSKKYALFWFVAVLVCWQIAGTDAAAQGTIDPCKSTATVNPGVVLVCPTGDGDPLTSPVGGGNCQITVTVRDNTNTGIPGIPAEDMWLVGCNNALLLCGGSEGSDADAPTNAAGTTTFSNEPVAGGCEPGLYVVVEGVILQNQGTCTPLCVPVAVRSPDYKSSGAPGPPPCAGDVICPDSKVSNADFSWFNTHYATAANPGAPYAACADFAAPLGAPIGLADFSKFTIHFAGAGHKCPI